MSFITTIHTKEYYCKLAVGKKVSVQAMQNALNNSPKKDYYLDICNNSLKAAFSFLVTDKLNILINIHKNTCLNTLSQQFSRAYANKLPLLKTGEFSEYEMALLAFDTKEVVELQEQAPKEKRA